jgi:pentatricopeptide repeat protein
MWDGAGVWPNELTVSSVLPSCAALGALALGRKVEPYSRGRGMLRNVYVANALVEMYAKCGSIRRAWKVFRGMGTRRDLCSWNSMIMAFAVHGLWTEALALFHKLRVRMSFLHFSSYPCFIRFASSLLDQICFEAPN